MKTVICRSLEPARTNTVVFLAAMHMDIKTKDVDFQYGDDRCQLECFVDDEQGSRGKMHKEREKEKMTGGHSDWSQYEKYLEEKLKAEREELKRKADEAKAAKEAEEARAAKEEADKDGAATGNRPEHTPVDCDAGMEEAEAAEKSSKKELVVRQLDAEVPAAKRPNLGEAQSSKR